MQDIILIVEDHAAVRMALRDWLGIAFPGFQFYDTGTGEEAIRLAQVHQPRLVLMDIQLPGMNGIEATRQIRASLPGTQVVMLTIYDDAAYHTDAAQAGAAAYVPKREMSTRLVPVLRSLLAHNATFPESIL